MRRHHWAVVGKLLMAIGFAVMAAFAVCRSAVRSAANAPAGNTPAASSAGARPVLVELFTSEGCSDCPPADALLANLAQTQPVAGAEIVPIEEHVDYFNSNAWADPFSSRAYTERQDRYRAAYRDSDVYTPEMIIQGGHGFVGSDRSQAIAGIRRAADKPSANITLETKRQAGDKLSVTVTTHTRDVSNAVVVLAVTQNGLSSDVRGGENSGRRLVHSAVARTMAPIGQISGPGSKRFTQTIALNPAWPAGDLNLVAFVQNPNTMKILGAAAHPVP